MVEREERVAFVARHALPLLLFAALAVGWTWPLVRHLGDALPGDPGDNYSFVWNLWWMRHVLATPGLGYFHTTYLFYPFGTTIVDHPNTALPAAVAATLLRRLPVAAAQNVLLLAYVFANMACMYALARSILAPGDADARAARRGAILAAIVFGLSPYVAVHLLGHFDLVAAWPLPLYALALRRAVDGRSGASAIAAGAVLAATAYTAYYYVVYLCFFTLVYVIAATRAFSVTRSTTPPATAVRRVRLGCAVAACISAAVAIAIAVTGGGAISAGAQEISARTPQNALTAMWIAIAVGAVATWRPTIRFHPSRPDMQAALAAGWRVAAVFVALAAPLLWEAARLIARGEYVTQQYGWRSIPQGVDLLAPLAGHPLHPLFGAAASRAYAVFGGNYIETIGWFGIVPLVVLAVSTRTSSVPDAALRRESRIWRAVAVVFAVWALGPFLTIGGFDTGLKLPAILLRFVPLVENARMPGRAIVIVFMALGALLAIRFAAARGRLRSPRLQRVLIAVIAFEYWAAPVRMTTIDRPRVYEALATAEPGAVCEAPMGIGDGLGVGVGSQDRRVLFYATQHEHPLVGGYVGRMPADARDRYRRTPIAATLLDVSDGAALSASADVDVTQAPCRYLVLHRSSSSAALVSYVEKLHARELAADADLALFQLR